ncbi:MAG: hypothetical protein J1G38_02025 [Clostridiales bacterium]|nr:hypothetical protein [Clostridiales bacterium]
MKLRKIITAIFAATVAACLSGCAPTPIKAAPDDSPPQADTRVVGYLPDWSYYFYGNLDFYALTHLNIAFCNPDVRGNLSCGIPAAQMKEIVGRAHAAGVKVMAALGGGGGCDGFLALLDTPAEMEDFNGKIMEYCEQNELDGIDLDIELDSSHKIWNYYGDWVVSLRELCDERGYELSTATAQWVSGKVTADTYALFDFVNVMAYDDDSDKNSHSSYECAVKSLEYFNINRAVEAAKLVLGVPFYGRGYKNGALDWGSYESFASLVAADPDNYCSDTYNGIAYNGAETIKDKCELAKGYGGIMIWEVSLDAVGEYSLLDVIKTEMLGK